LIQWLPTDEQKAAARNKLPYLERSRFTHQRADDRSAVSFTYIRRPSYYAVFNAGEFISAQQRYGLGMLWHPQAGALLQSQTGSDAAAWGTRMASDSLVYEASSFSAVFTVDGRPVTVSPGACELPDGELKISYSLGTNGRKQIGFDDAGIEIKVEHRGEFVETLSLLRSAEDELSLSAGVLQLRRGDTTMNVTFEPKVTPRVVAAQEGQRSAQRFRIGSRQLLIVTIDASEELTYRITFRSDT
jgi:hypothetical protein